MERFLAALRTGRLQELMEVLAPDVVLIADGGGLAAAAWPRSTGPSWWRGCSRTRAGTRSLDDRVAQRRAAGRIEVAGEPAAVSLVVENGRVTRVYLVRNPRKLTRLDEPADLAR